MLGIGDDAAVWRPSRSNLSVITTDALIENVHFARDLMSARDVGHRAMAANLSDIAAMGARPVLATIALGFPPDIDAEWVLAMYDGLVALARTHACAIVGGDITRAPAIAIAITVVGEVRASNLKRRADARIGDVLAVSGPLGASRAGLEVLRSDPARAHANGAARVVAAYRRPEPRMREGRWFGASRNVHALMDSSDGLATDLARLCAASGVGAVVESVPVDPDARAIAVQAGDDPEAYALGGGEDFELIAAIEPRAFRYLASRYRARFGRDLLRIGNVSEGSSLRFANGAPIAHSGWDHLRG